MNLEQTLLKVAAERRAKETCTIADLKVAIEFKPGDIRKGKDKYGRPWEVKMPFAYGRIESTLGMDGENVDVILGPKKNPSKAWVIGLPVGHGNEDKVMLGFSSKQEAVRAFLQCYQGKRKFVGSVKEMSISKLKRRLISRRGKRISAMFETSPISNFQYQGFDPVPPKDTTSVDTEGYKPRTPLEKFEEKMRKSPENIKFYTELTRRLGAKTIAETAIAENWPYGGVDGLP